MKTVIAFLAVVSLLIGGGGAAQAQSWEVSAFSSYTPATGFDRHASELNQLNIQDSFTWGVQAARLFTPHWGAEALFSQQKSALEIGTTDGGRADLFSMTMRQVQGNIVYEFGDRINAVRPFVFGGIGTTFFSARDLQSETKLSFDYGAGLKYAAWRDLGIRLHARFKPSVLNDKAAGDVCDPFGFCRNWLSQIEIAAGAIVRF